MKQTKKRYYKVNETVWVKPEKALGVIKSLDINPKTKTYKATVEITRQMGEATIIRTLTVDLWELNKEANKYFKEKRKRERLNGLNKVISQVKEFHEAFGHPVADKPTTLTRERAEARVAWTVDEVQREFLEATDVVGQADAVIDGIYFLAGTLVEMGIQNSQELFDIVQKANMGKLHNVNGEMKAVYREDGKIIKPDNWEKDFAPEGKLREAIENYI